MNCTEYSVRQNKLFFNPIAEGCLTGSKIHTDFPHIDAECGIVEELEEHIGCLAESALRKILTAMLDAVYVDAKEEKAVVAIRPKPAFRPVFEIATTREGSNVALITTTPPDFSSPEASNSCSWWRRGRVELPQEHGLEVLLVAAWHFQI